MLKLTVRYARTFFPASSQSAFLGKLEDSARKEMTMLKLTIRYARYVLSALATVGFSLRDN